MQYSRGIWRRESRQPSRISQDSAPVLPTACLCPNILDQMSCNGLIPHHLPVIQGSSDPRSSYNEGSGGSLCIKTLRTLLVHAQSVTSAGFLHLLHPHFLIVRGPMYFWTLSPDYPHPKDLPPFLQGWTASAKWHISFLCLNSCQPRK